MLGVVESKLRRGFWIVGILAVGVVCGSTGARALDLTIGGAFDDDNDVFLLDFSMSAAGPFVAFTSNFDPNDPLTDPIDPQLQLFVGTGPSAVFALEDDDGANGFSADVAGTIYTGEGLDSLINSFPFVLPAGTYTLGLSSFDNDPLGTTLGDGYSGDGFSDGPFRVHLLGIDEVLRTRGPAPVSPSFSPNNLVS